MIRFLSVKADIENHSFENIEYLPFLIGLFLKNKRLITDDCFPQDDGKLVDFVVKEINAVYPWFLVAVKDYKPIGAAWVTHWHKGAYKYHSCQIHGCMDRKFFGETALVAVDELVKFLHKTTGAMRFQVEIPEFNALAVNFAKKAGFVEEGLIKCATVKNGKPLNHVLLAKIINIS